MKAILLTAILLALFEQTSPGPQRQTNLELTGLVGPVYAVRSQKERFDERTGGWRYDKTHTTDYYDRQGNVIVTVEYGDGGAIRKTTYAHDAAGEVAEKIESLIKPDGHGKPALRTETLRETLSYKDGRLVQRSLVDTKGKTISVTSYSYDDRGRIAETHERKEGDRDSFRTTFKYGEGKNPIESTLYYPQSKMYSKREYEYQFDARQNWTGRDEHIIGPGESRERLGTVRTITYYSADSAKGPAIAGESPDDPLQATEESAQDYGPRLQGFAIRRVQPAYPSLARMAHITGTVIVEVTIDYRGKVTSARAVSGPSELRQAAVEAARQWKFKPLGFGGDPTRVFGTITFNFSQ